MNTLEETFSVEGMIDDPASVAGEARVTGTSSNLKETVVEDVASNVEKKGKKKTKPLNKNAKKDLKNKGLSKYLLQFDFSFDDTTLQRYKELFSQVNQKNMGSPIGPEMVLKKLLEYVNEDFILELQRESLSSEDMKNILKNHVSRLTH